ncbi:MAG: hypothetical protein AAB217_07650, partial [Chloroflexota bacterium]
RDAGRTGAAGTSINGSWTNKFADKGKIGFFYTTICSGRDRSDPKDGGDYILHGPHLTPAEDEDCTRVSDSVSEEDAGGPGDRVYVMVRFNHPLITPLAGLMSFYGNVTGQQQGFGQQVTLRAQRDGIVERFRISDVAEVGLGGAATLTQTFTASPTSSLTPTLTPSNTATKTFTPTKTFTASKTNTPTNTATFTNTATKTATATSTAVPSCDILGTDSNEPLYISGISGNGGGKNRVNSKLTNNSPTYDVVLTSIKVDWNGGWHDAVGTLAAQTLTKYQLGGSDILLVSPNLSFNSGPINTTHTFNTGSRTIGKSTNKTLSLVFAQNTTFLHGRDFRLQIFYTVNGLNCSVVVQGRYGPTVTANMPAGSINAPFVISANATDPDGTITEVIFEIYDSAGVKVLSRKDTSSPYCLANPSGATCNAINPNGNWPSSNNGGPGGGKITNGAYTIYIYAKDNDTNKQATRIKTTFSINAPTVTPSNTPKPSNTPTKTKTPGATNTPTITKTP